MVKTEKKIVKYLALVLSHLFILAMILGCSSAQDTTSEPDESEDVSEEEVIVEEEVKQETGSDSPRRMSDDELRAFFEPIGPMPIPEDNPMTDEKIELGNTLFVDHRLSGNGMLSCLTCHSPGAGYSDGQPTSIGFEGVVLGRNSPTIINSGYFDELFWDGRAGSLEEQALGPIQDPNEMNQTLEGLVKVVESIEGYKTMFDAAFDGVISAENIAKALAAFQRTIFINDTKHDQFIAGDDDALTEVQKYGMEILEDQSWFCIRPSGTEPKVKFYFGVKKATHAESDQFLAQLRTELMDHVHQLI